MNGVIGTLTSKLGQNVMWKTDCFKKELRQLSKYLGENLTDTMLHKDSGFNNTTINEGVVIRDKKMLVNKKIYCSATNKQSKPSNRQHK